MTPGARYACTWLYAEPAGEGSTYYQVRGRSSSPSFQATYWRSVGLFFATSQRQQQGVRHLLFTNVDALPVVDGIAMASLLESLDVEVVHLPMTFRTPAAYYHAWANQFYVFDIVRYLAARLARDDAALVLDADCVWVRATSELWEAVSRDGTLTYVIDYPPEHAINGLTRVELSRISSELLGRAVERPLVYCGGELLAGTGSALGELAREIDTVWPSLMERHDAGERTFTEEGQTLSYLYSKLGYPLGNGDRFIRRIWTGSFGIFNNARADDTSLSIWHLPLEKRFGIRRLFPDIADRSSEFWRCPAEPQLRDLLGSVLGVPENTLRKSAKDLLRRVADVVRER